MADYFIDHGAYGLTTNRLGLDAPVTWGVPQEGDGSSKDAATASAIASIAFGSVPTSGTFSCCGVTISTTGVLSAANVDASANTLAVNINASTTAVAAGVAVGTPQLRNLVYARGPSGGAPAGTCQIMMRIGSTRLNQAVNSNAAIASTFNGTPTLVQFAGGTGGCWGWEINPVALGAGSSIALATYGAFMHKPYVTSTNVFPALTDIIWHRTGGGADKNVDISLAPGSTVSAPSSYGSRHVYDTNTKWTGDATSGYVDLEFIDNAWGSEVTLKLSVGGAHCVAALSNGGLRIAYGGSASNGGLSIIAGDVADAGIDHSNVWYVDRNISGSATNFMAMPKLSSAIRGFLRFTKCKFTRTYSATFIPQLALTHYSSAPDVLFDGCVFDWPITGAGDPGAIINSSSSGIMDGSLRYLNCQFIGKSGSFTIYSGSNSHGVDNTDHFAEFSNCSGLAFPSSYWGYPTAALKYGRPFHRLQIAQPNGDYRYEDIHGVSEWYALGGYPTLSATLPGSGTPMSIRHLLVNGVIVPGFPYIPPPLRLYYTDTSAVRTISVECFLPTALTFTPGDVVAVIGYTDSTGVQRSEQVDGFSASSASWTGAGSFPTYGPRKMSATTEYAIAQYSEIVINTYFNKSPSSGANEYVYVDPAPSVS